MYKYIYIYIFRKPLLSSVNDVHVTKTKKKNIAKQFYLKDKYLVIFADRVRPILAFFINGILKFLIQFNPIFQ